MSADKASYLYQTYKSAMLRAALQMTDDYHMAEDAVQQAFVKLMGILDRVNEKEKRKTGGLLVVMTRQAMADLFRKKKHDVGEVVDCFTMKNEPMDDTDMVDRLLQKNSISNLREALQWLPEKYATPIILKYGNEFRNEEIAKLLNMNNNTINTHIKRGKQLIREHFQERGDEQ